MVRREGSTGSSAPRHAPAPEGPEEIAERVQRAREGRPTAARRRLARMSGLEKLSPVQQVLTLFAVTVETSLLALSFLTDLPTSWLLTTAFLVLPLLLHYFERADRKGAGRGADRAKTAARARGAARTARGVARRAGHGRRT